MQIVNTPRIRLPAAALIAWFSLASRVALTQPFPLPTLAPAFPFPGVPPGDADRIQAAAARLREDRSIGTVERWRNPDTKDAGEVELIRRFNHNGMPCRTIRYTIRYNSHPDRLYRSVVNWCRVPEGAWKIVEIPQGGRKPHSAKKPRSLPALTRRNHEQQRLLQQLRQRLAQNRSSGFSRLTSRGGVTENGGNWKKL